MSMACTGTWTAADAGAVEAECERFIGIIRTQLPPRREPRTAAP